MKGENGCGHVQLLVNATVRIYLQHPYKGSYMRTCQKRHHLAVVVHQVERASFESTFQTSGRGVMNESCR